jgi:protoheme IX farnesyltransferase
MFKLYYRLTKPGIIYGNSLATAAGFLLASKGDIAFGTFVAAVVGSGLIIGASCVVNNYIDRGIDAKMDRTKNRALVSGKISVVHALLFAALLFASGFGLLAAYTNWLTVLVGAVGVVVYVVLYGIAKRRTVHGTLVGSIAGAVPPVAGYTAVTGALDAGAGLLFLILATWQMPHFYAIAMYRAKDYANAGLPVLPVAKGMRVAKVQIVAYVCLFAMAALALAAFGYTGWVYAVVMFGLSLVWFNKGLRGFDAADDAKWARGMFGFSLIVLLAWCALLALEAWLP